MSKSSIARFHVMANEPGENLALEFTTQAGDRLRLALPIELAEALILRLRSTIDRKRSTAGPRQD